MDDLRDELERRARVREIDSPKFDPDRYIEEVMEKARREYWQQIAAALDIETEKVREALTAFRDAMLAAGMEARDVIECVTRFLAEGMELLQPDPPAIRQQRKRKRPPTVIRATRQNQIVEKRRPKARSTIKQRRDRMRP